MFYFYILFNNVFLRCIHIYSFTAGLFLLIIPWLEICIHHIQSLVMETSGPKLPKCHCSEDPCMWPSWVNLCSHNRRQLGLKICTFLISLNTDRLLCRKGDAMETPNRYSSRFIICCWLLSFVHFTGLIWLFMWSDLAFS